MSGSRSLVEDGRAERIAAHAQRIQAAEQGRRPDVCSCWACNKPSPCGARVTHIGWKVRRMCKWINVKEVYCQDCFKKWGWVKGKVYLPVDPDEGGTHVTLGQALSGRRGRPRSNHVRSKKNRAGAVAKVG